MKYSLKDIEKQASGSEKDAKFISVLLYHEILCKNPFCGCIIEANNVLENDYRKYQCSKCWAYFALSFEELIYSRHLEVFLGHQKYLVPIEFHVDLDTNSVIDDFLSNTFDFSYSNGVITDLVKKRCKR